MTSRRGKVAHRILHEDVGDCSSRSRRVCNIIFRGVLAFAHLAGPYSLFELSPNSTFHMVVDVDTETPALAMADQFLWYPSRAPNRMSIIRIQVNTPCPKCLSRMDVWQRAPGSAVARQGVIRSFMPPKDGLLIQDNQRLDPIRQSDDSTTVLTAAAGHARMRFRRSCT